MSYLLAVTLAALKNALCSLESTCLPIAHTTRCAAAAVLMWVALVA